MVNSSFIIAVSHFFSPISATSAESRSYIIIFRFKNHETLQINQSNKFLSSPLQQNVTFVLLYLYRTSVTK